MPLPAAEIQRGGKFEVLSIHKISTTPYRYELGDLNRQTDTVFTDGRVKP